MSAGFGCESDFGVRNWRICLAIRNPNCADRETNRRAMRRKIWGSVRIFNSVLLVGVGRCSCARQVTVVVSVAIAVSVVIANIGREVTVVVIVGVRCWYFVRGRPGECICSLRLDGRRVP